MAQKKQGFPRMSAETIRVLLVDDSEVDFQIASKLLAKTETRYKLEWASSYDEGMELLQKKEYDVCLLDYWLDCGKTGIDLPHALKKQHLKSPIIMLTGQSSHELDQEAMRAGASDYLVKSRFDRELLERAIRHALERQRIIAEIETVK